MIPHQTTIAIIDFPHIIKTKNGIRISPWKNDWCYRDTLKDVSLYFSRLPVEQSLRDAIKYTFIWYAENRSPFYLIRIYEGLLRFFNYNAKSIPIISMINIELITAYKSSLSQNNEYLLGGIVGFFKRMYRHNIGGITNDAMGLIEKLSFKGNTKGSHILTMDPERGPFSEIELQAIYSRLYDSYRQKIIPLGDFLLIWLFSAMGHRPIQYAALRIRDFQINLNSKEDEIFSLDIPRAKQRNACTRSIFRSRLLISDIGRKFVEYTSFIKTKAHSLGIADPSEFPMFPAAQKDFEAPPGFEWHQTSQALSLHAKHIVSSLGIQSERTGQRLNVPPQRFRYTVGTRAAIEGHGELVIAELLDHTDIQSVGVYVKAVPELIEKFTPKLALQLAPLANAFKGKIIRNESEGKIPGDPSLRIFALQHTGSMKPTGSCGQHRLCKLLEPLACYTCRSFQPWLDGPHETVLERLIEDRERIFASTNGDKRVASINDFTMLAVAEVVRQCRHMQDVKGP